MEHIVVIGGGLSGLATAYNIQSLANEHGKKVKVTVIEKEAVSGGKIKSINDDGYLCEWGPNGFLTNKPHTLELCKKLNLTSQLLSSNDNARKRFVYSGGKLHKLPHNQVEFLTNSLISLFGKLRIAKEFFIAQKTDNTDESLAEFTLRRLGKEALDKLIAPMASGIFAGNPETMSLKACFPRINQLETEYGGLLKAMLKLAKQHAQDKKSGKVTSSPAGPGGVLTSFQNGIQDLTIAIANAIGQNNLIHGKCVTNISHEIHDKWRIVLDENEELVADKIVLALPAYAAAKLTKTLDAELSAKLLQIKYSPLAVVCLGCLADDISYDMNGFGYLFANNENEYVLGTLWDSSIFANRTADGKIMLRSMLGGAKFPDILKFNDSELIEITRSSINKAIGVNINPEMVKVFRHEYAIPQYNIGHLDLVKSIENSVNNHSGLYLTGNAYYGVGINDCTAAAVKVAHNVLGIC